MVGAATITHPSAMADRLTQAAGDLDAAAAAVDATVTLADRAAET